MSKKAASPLSGRTVFPPIPLGDNFSNISSVYERRASVSGSRIRKRNPFSEKRRINFPDVNDVFESTMTSSSKLVDGDKRNIMVDDSEEGCYQYSDIDSSSVLNMSIGARAALNDHARYVAKFGIDGEKNIEAESITKINTGLEINSEIQKNLLLDEQWERLLDSSRVASSFGGSISEGIPSPPNSTTVKLQFDNSSTERNRWEESSSIEIMTDVSHDFFNSSRVNLLVTPERNKNRQAGMVMTRDKVCGGDINLDARLRSESGIESEVFYYDDANDGDKFLESSRSQHGGRSDCSDLETSFFNIADISRISNNTVSDTPDTSFQNYQRQDTRINFVDEGKNHNIGFEFTAFLRSDSPSRILNDSSILSVPSGSYGKKGSPSRSSLTEQSHSEEKTYFSSGNRIMSTESVSVGKSFQSSSVQSAVSAFIVEARTFARQVVSDVEKSIEGMESFPADFLRGMEIGQTNTPSPISPVSSSPATSRRDGITREQRRFKRSLKSDCYGGSSINSSACNKSYSSFTSPAAEDTIQIHLTGRQRYRTVVPRRVYLDQPTQQFNEEQDSFFAVQSNPETIRIGGSLSEPFEEATTHKTL